MMLKMLLLSSDSAPQMPNIAAHHRWLKITCFFATVMVVMIGHSQLVGDPAKVVLKKTTIRKRQTPPPSTKRKSSSHPPIKVENIREENEKNEEGQPQDGSSSTPIPVASNASSKTSSKSENRIDKKTTKPPRKDVPQRPQRESASDESREEKSASGTSIQPISATSKDDTADETDNNAVDDNGDADNNDSKDSLKEDEETTMDRLSNFTKGSSSNDSDSNNNNDTFVVRWCELQGAEWYPTGQDAWQQRAPYFLLPGAKKSGTTALASYIMQHRNVVKARTKELQFFLNKNFRGSYVTATRKTAVKKAREAMYARDYHHKALEEDESAISFDGTPGYLFFSTILPQRILCVCPWVKLVVILRNPVDRAYSNWAYAARAVNLKVPFEQWIEQDFNFMKEAGLVHDWSRVDFEAFAGSQQEDDAWSEYLRLTNEGPIGRGMYEMQLRHWYQAMESVGRDPKTEILVLRSEDLKQNVDEEYNKVLEFLDLPEHQLASKTERVVTNYTAAMNATTRQMLEDFYAPYNERLYRFLGGEDWKGFWDPSPPTRAES